ncbi:MAG: hypothetical protein WKG06_43545 [Segetibacter sp.]
MCNWLAKETARGKTMAIVAGLDITAVINNVQQTGEDAATS